MAKLNSKEEKILKEISSWKAEGTGWLNQVTHFISKPILWVGDNVIPDSAKASMGSVSEKIVERLQDISQWTVNEEDVLKATKEFEIDSETILHLKKASIFDLDHVAEQFIKSNSAMAAAEGFGTGLIGWPGLIADMPALFTLCFRQMYQISLTYGFPLEDPEKNPKQAEFEIEFMLRVFRVSTASNREERMQGLLDLKDFESAHLDEVTQKVGGDFTRNQIGKQAAIQVSTAIINQIIKQTLARKAITSIPGIGAVLTAGFNYSYTKDVGETAFNLYRERFLLDKKGRQKIVNIDIE